MLQTTNFTLFLTSNFVLNIINGLEYFYLNVTIPLLIFNHCIAFHTTLFFSKIILTIEGEVEFNDYYFDFLVS